MENLQITKKVGTDSHSLSIPQIEEKLDDILRINGEDGLNSIRDKARNLSAVLDMPRQFEMLNKIIGALFTTRPSKILKSDLAISHAAGLPYDKERIKIFKILFDYLHNHEFKDHPENYADLYNYLNVHNAFYEPNEGKHLLLN